MKILITNTAISERSGSELYVKELAEELKARKHTVAIYSNVLGPLAEKIKQSGVIVIDDLSQLNFQPDIIHGQHHLEIMTALAFFRHTPAICFLHGWRPWQSTPPVHPRIIEYAAVDLKTLTSAVTNHRIPRNKIRIIHNFVDTKRFKARNPLPPRPKKAAIFSNYASEENYVPLVRQTCQKFNIELDVIGSSSNNLVKNPERILENYDLIFAFGRSALEALATGNALIICGIWGIGPMVEPKNMDRLRDLNFGVAAVYDQVNLENLSKEIKKYNAENSLIVSENIRKKANLETTVDKIEALYSETLKKYARMKIEPQAEAVAVSNYIKTVSRLLKEKHQELDELYHQQNFYRIELAEKQQALSDLEKTETKLIQAEISLKREGAKIRLMRSSKFWKMRKKYLTLKHLLLPKR